jgi:hypothetical protein
MTNDRIEKICQMSRTQLKNIENELRYCLEEEQFEEDEYYQGQHEEVKAQLYLAIRHIEDARMRCGKVLQYSGDGVSIYDKMNKV